MALAAPLAAAPALTMAALVATVLVAAVAVHPPLAAYVLLGVTPLIVGIDRGSLLPLLRPSEALAALLAAGLATNAIIRMSLGHRLRFRPTKVDAALALLAFAGSVIPILWMVVRAKAITADDALYALNLWKYFGVYLLVRSSIRSPDEVRRCLSISMGAASVVAVVAFLQALQVFGIPRLLASYYAPAGIERLVHINRGTSTLGSSIATGDVMAFNLAIALGWLAKGGGRRPLLVGAAGLFVLGGFASGQYSAVIALVVAVAAIGVVTRQLTRRLLALLPTAFAAGLVLQPVIERRLSGFSSGGLPPSWTGRWENLRENFWPELFSDFNYLLGVRPAARIPNPDPWRDYAWIESGHTWLLWSGGIPLLATFVAFCWITLRTTAFIARGRSDAIGVAAIAACSAVAVVAVLMTLDAHLILRGAADLLFSLLALALTSPQARSSSSAAPVRPVPSPTALA